MHAQARALLKARGWICILNKLNVEAELGHMQRTESKSQLCSNSAHHINQRQPLLTLQIRHLSSQQGLVLTCSLHVRWTLSPPPFLCRGSSCETPQSSCFRCFPLLGSLQSLSPLVVPGVLRSCCISLLEGEKKNR